MTNIEKLRALLAAATPWPRSGTEADGLKWVVANADLIAAAVNALPELLDAVDDLALAKQNLSAWEASPFSGMVDLLASDETKNCAAIDFDRTRDGAKERWILTAQKADGKAPLDRVVELERALATAEAERLTLARALYSQMTAMPVAVSPGEVVEPFANVSAGYTLARRIVAEADAASGEVGRG